MDRNAMFPRKCLFCTAFFLLSPPALLDGEDATFQMFDQAFVPTNVEISAGEEVTWIWREGTHRVTSGFSSDPEDRPGELFQAPLDEAHTTFSFRFSSPGEYPFFDSLNELTGGTGVVTVRSDAETFRVGVVDNAFIPEDLTIFEGDTVHWEHEPNEAFHTVTSGRSSRPEDNPGSLFDAESSDAKPNFFYTFDLPAHYPYFCRPHEHLDMRGSILVQQRFIRGDFAADGSVDISDPIEILSFLFLGPTPSKCLDAADSDDSGLVNVTDAVNILTVLFLGGLEIPPPFPNRGPDRTEDSLLCEI